MCLWRGYVEAGVVFHEGKSTFAEAYTEIGRTALNCEMKTLVVREHSRKTGAYTGTCEQNATLTVSQGRKVLEFDLGQSGEYGHLAEEYAYPNSDY